MSARKPELTQAQRLVVEQARSMADAEADKIAPGEYEPGDRRAYVIALGRVQGRMISLLGIIDELTGGRAGSPLADQLAALADSIDRRLDDEEADRQTIAEDVAAQLRALARGGAR